LLHPLGMFLSQKLALFARAQHHMGMTEP
jgi:hypothetical protein